MSWRSADTRSSSRSPMSASRAMRSAARCAATAWRRKRSGCASQPGMRSKKSNTAVRAASASTPLGVNISTASGIVATRARLGAGARLAIRSTAITSETSDSMAATTSPGEVCSSRTSRRTRLRDSASAGNASSASKAAVSRRPWPSPVGRAAAAGVELSVRSGTGFSALFTLVGLPIRGWGWFAFPGLRAAGHIIGNSRPALKYLVAARERSPGAALTVVDGCRTPFGGRLKPPRARARGRSWRASPPVPGRPRTRRSPGRPCRR